MAFMKYATSNLRRIRNFWASLQGEAYNVYALCNPLLNREINLDLKQNMYK